MRAVCDAPLWLTGLIPCALLVLSLLRLSCAHSWRWRMVCTLLPGMAAAFLVLALAEPRFIYQPRARAVVVLLDLSPSTRTSPWQRPAWLHEFAGAHLPPQTQVHVIGFSDHAREICAAPADPSDASWPAAWPPIGGQTTDLAAALAWGSADEFRTAPRWLITDGGAAFPPSAELPGQLAATILPPARTDVGITRLQIVPLEPAAPAAPPNLEIWATLSSTGPAAGVVEFFRDGRSLARQALAFKQAGTQVLRVRDRLNTEHQERYSVRIFCGDPWPEDDTAEIFGPAAGPPQVIVATKSPALYPKQAGTTVVEPRALPTSLAGLTNTQLVVLDDVPAEALPPGADVLLQHYVEDTGGGLLLSGATAAFGPGHYPQCALEALSPLAALPPTPHHIVFLIDASGSMNELARADRPGNKFALALSGVEQALRLLGPEDEAAVITFSGHGKLLAQHAIRNFPAAELGAFKRTVPTGPTNPDSALGVLALKPDALLILLTDGEIPAMDVPRWGKLLADAKAHLAIVAPRVQGGTLATLAQATHGTWLTTDDPAQWPPLLMQALEDALAGQARRTPLRWTAIGRRPLQGQTTRWIETFTKPETRLYATSTEAAHPLAATARRGLGQVGAIAFTDSGPDYAALVALVRGDILASAGDRRFRVQAERQGNLWQVTADGSDAHGFINGDSLVVHPSVTEGLGHDVELREIGPGRYVATLDAGTGPFAAVVTRPHGQPALVARLNPATVPTSEWPATAVGTMDLPAASLILRPGDGILWQPRQGARVMVLEPILIPAAAALLLGALLWRRGNRRAR